MAKLLSLVEQALDLAKQKGATSAEVHASEGVGQSITARAGDVETVEFNREKGLQITAYIGTQKGSATTSDTTPEAIAQTVEKAIEIASVTESDKFYGIPDATLFATTEHDIDIYHDWQLDTESAIQQAIELESLSLEADKKIIQCDGANVHLYTAEGVIGNSNGLLKSARGSRYVLSTVLIAKDANGMQRDYSYDCKRDYRDLMDLKSIADKAAKRTVSRLDAKSLPTGKVDVIFDAALMQGVLGHFIGAASGGAIYRNSSFLCDKLGETIFSPLVNLIDDPFIPKGLGSRNFDQEGVAVKPMKIVENGVLNTYFLSNYSAKRLKMTPTGHAGGVSNLVLTTQNKSFEDLCREMNRGFYVTEVMGQGVNLVTGDYSRGAAGFWVEDGNPQYFVEGVTIASNLKDMFKNIAGIANDVDTRSNLLTGSVWVKDMMVAGA